MLKMSVCSVGFVLMLAGCLPKSASISFDVYPVLENEVEARETLVDVLAHSDLEIYFQHPSNCPKITSLAESQAYWCDYGDVVGLGGVIGSDLYLGVTYNRKLSRFSLVVAENDPRSKVVSAAAKMASGILIRRLREKFGSESIMNVTEYNQAQSKL